MRHLHVGVPLCILVLCAGLATAQVTVSTYQYDTSRSGANTHETTLTPSNVSVSTFGKVRTFSVTGYVYAQPLYMPNLVIGGTSHNVVFIATEHDQVYAFDVNSGALLWQANLLKGTSPLDVVTSVPSSDVSCDDLVPEIGITGTPVIDTTTNTMYVVAKIKEYNPQTRITRYYHRLHGLDITTGLDKIAVQTVVALVRGTGTGSVGGTIAFNPLIQSQRASLLLADGQVIVAWASHCDLGTYHGWLMSFDKSTLALTGAFMDTPNGEEGGFWGGGSGPAADAGGSIFIPTGNGDFTVNNGGIDYGDSVLRLHWSSTGFSVTDYFTPWDQQTLDNNDTDVASGGVMLLPDQSGQYPHLLLQVGKEGTIDLINRDNMGHFHPGNDSQIVQTLPSAIGGIWGGMAFWNNYAYFSGQYDHLKAYTFNPSTEKLSSNPTSVSPEGFTYPGPTPNVSSNGTSNGILWLIQADDSSSNAVLHAFKATNVATELYNSAQNSNRDFAGLRIKFSVPTVADGHVFVGAQNQVAMFGLLQ